LDNKTLIGSTGLHTRQGEHVFEIGYWIRKSELKKGYALETTKALTKVGMEIAGKQRMEIHCDPNNINSLNIPKKIGYTHEATLKNRTIGTSGNLSDDMVWTLFKEDYQTSIAKEIEIKVYNSLEEQIY
jgi:RimJ/RimL family protein N-acetyltransferase